MISYYLLFIKHSYVKKAELVKAYEYVIQIFAVFRLMRTNSKHVIL